MYLHMHPNKSKVGFTVYLSVDYYEYKLFVVPEPSSSESSHENFMAPFKKHKGIFAKFCASK